MVNKTTWELLIKLYSGGPLIDLVKYPKINLDYHVPSIGLLNEISDSHINSVFQCLFSIDAFTTYFFKNRYKSENENQ